MFEKKLNSNSSVIFLPSLSGKITDFHVIQKVSRQYPDTRFRDSYPTDLETVHLLGMSFTVHVFPVFHWEPNTERKRERVRRGGVGGEVIHLK